MILLYIKVRRMMKTLSNTNKSLRILGKKIQQEGIKEIEMTKNVNKKHLEKDNH